MAKGFHRGYGLLHHFYIKYESSISYLEARRECETFLLPCSKSENEMDSDASYLQTRESCKYRIPYAFSPLPMMINATRYRIRPAAVKSGFSEVPQSRERTDRSDLFTIRLLKS